MAALPRDAALDSAEAGKALDFLQQGALPQMTPALPPDPAIKAAIDAVENFKPDPEIKSLLAQVSDQSLEAALQTAVDRTLEFDSVMKPVSLSLDQFDGALARQSGLAQERRDFTATRLRYTVLRYEAESRLNQAIGNLYELKVRKNNISAERHHERSQRFFYGMLAAQLAVIVATFAIAARQRNLLWSLAAAVGLLAVAIAVYVYICV